ncbi:SAGA complex subunit Sgf73 [Malassezia obtusa]|uniref:SAGA complex subunit Sgf73 n=1 Tax=Malassezia obtusa TaxID=76774 RepID=A0AAF0E212_9BASI|nr:SAGA complex subunit Sgf73 [Malassezia obtusa]
MGKPLGWDAILEETQSAPSSPAPDGRRPWQIDERDVTEFGPFSLDDDVDVVECEHCQKPILREAYAYHQANCAMARDIQAGRLPAAVLQDTKVQPMDVEPDAPAAEAKDAPDTPRRKHFGGKKNRGPINLDRQCGVINNKGLPCSRSLTCKSHSMGAKRNVPGRSQPYDTLLFEWQKATNPAFVARLEEKERAIAAAKAMASASKEKKRKPSASSERTRDAGAEQDVLGLRTAESGSDMYAANATYQEVERDLHSVLHTIHLSATRDRTAILPMAVRGFAGQYTTRTKRFRALRQFLAQGLSGTAHMHARQPEAEASK